MRTFLSLILAALCSCSQLEYTATTNAGTESFKYTSFGGSETMETAGGTRYVGNRNKSTGQFFQTVTAVAGGISMAYAEKSKNALSATQAQQQTAREANARAPTIVPAQAVAPDTTVFPLVVPPAKPIVP